METDQRAVDRPDRVNARQAAQAAGLIRSFFLGWAGNIVAGWS